MMKTLQKFHLKTKPYVERILLFNNEYLGEMTRIEMDDSAIFNGETEGPVNLIMLLGDIGSVKISLNKVLSRPLTTRPSDANQDHAGNALVVNWFRPATIEDAPMPDCCIIDFPEIISQILGLPELIILQKYELPETVSNQQAPKRGFDPNADGYFIKIIHHLWPEKKKTLEILNVTDVKISLYQKVIQKQMKL